MSRVTRRRATYLHADRMRVADEAWKMGWDQGRVSGARMLRSDQLRAQGYPLEDVWRILQSEGL